MLQIKTVSKDMKKSTNKPKFIKRISPKETLMSMEVGDTVIIPTKNIKTPAIRMAALRIEQKKDGKFYITEQGMINETQVTRLK